MHRTVHRARCPYRLLTTSPAISSRQSDCPYRGRSTRSQRGCTAGTASTRTPVSLLESQSTRRLPSRIEAARGRSRRKRRRVACADGWSEGLRERTRESVIGMTIDSGGAGERARNVTCDVGDGHATSRGGEGDQAGGEPSADNRVEGERESKCHMSRRFSNLVAWISDS